MAIFDDALKVVLKNEGGYTYHPNDTGGETYRGVSRNNFPKWSGWNIIDEAKKTDKGLALEAKLLDNQELQELIFDWYRVNFWNEIKGDYIISQKIALSIFDMAVNAGVSQAAKLAQRLIDVKDDGIIGSITIDKINRVNPDDFVSAYKESRINFYKKICEKRPANLAFLNGWTKRAERVANA